MLEPRLRRASATAEELAARRQRSVPAQTRQTHDDERVSVTPRSAIRHRPIGNMYVIPFTDGSEMHVTERELDTLPEEYQNAAQRIQPNIAAPRQRRQPQGNPNKAQPPDVITAPPARTTQAQQYNPTVGEKVKGFLGRVFIVVGILLLIMIVGWIVLSALGNWWQGVQDYWHYGMPRTYQIDYNVGHGTAQNPTSHFIAENLNKHIIVIEIPGDEASKARIYIGPTLIGPGEELTPVTLSFEDVNTDGRPDLVIHVGDAKYIFLNQRDGTFKPAPNQ